MEGLEISEIPKSQLLVDNESFRLDSEFNLKPHREAIQKVIAFGAEQFDQSEPDIIHPHEIEREYTESGGIWFFRAQNGRPLQIDDTDKVYISEKDAKLLTRNKLKQSDVLITRTGANRGDCSYFNAQEVAVASSHTLIVRSNKWGHEFLVAFFNSYYGKAQVDKGVYGAVQPQIAPYYLRKSWIPNCSPEFQEAIRVSFERAGRIRQDSNLAFDQAEQTLLHALGLDNWQPPEPLTYTRRASDAFAAKRFDAEYFYPAKKAALDYLAALPGTTVGEMFSSVRDLWQPEAAIATSLVRNYDLTDALSPFLDDTKPPILPAEISSTKKRIEKGDIVVSRLRSYLKEIAVVLEGGDVPMVGSTEYIVLRPKRSSMRVETLLIYLRSTLPQLIFKWSQDGSNHPRFDERELLSLRVPDLIRDHEEEVAEKVLSAIAARQQARELLERARRAVEIAIEENEAAGLAYLKAD